MFMSHDKLLSSSAILFTIEHGLTIPVTPCAAACGQTFIIHFVMMLSSFLISNKQKNENSKLLQKRSNERPKK